jgi:hypothetical protein
MDRPETPLQRFVRLALEGAPRARDHYDKLIQQQSGTKGKPLYDLQRGKALNPSSAMLERMANVLEQPFDLMRQAARGELVDPVPHVGGGPLRQPPSFEEMAEDYGLALIEEIDLALGMGGTFLDSEGHAEVKGIVPFRASWLRDITRSPVSSLKVVRGSGDSMQPTIQDGDFVLIDTSRRRIDEQDVIWAVSYGDLGMIRRLRQLPGGNVMMMPDNAVVRPTEASDGELWIMGRVIWIGRRM